MSDVTDPAADPASDPTHPEVASEASSPVRAPRLARHTITLADGHAVGLAVSGRGVPIVVIHGYTAEGFLYAQTLNRLVKRGFKVIAIDMAGHGSTQGLPQSGGQLGDYAELLARVIDELGIRRAIYAGHSLGGRCVTDYAAANPDRVIAAMLLNAIVGDTWDRITTTFRFAPWLMLPFGAALIGDSLSTMPVLSDREQTMKLGRLAMPTVIGHAVQPWRLIGPAVSILRSAPSRPQLERLAAQHVPTFVIHGDRDPIVPICTASEAAKRSGGQFVRIKGAGHSWLLKDPESFPAIVEDLLETHLGMAIRNSITGAGAASVDELEDELYEPGALILDLTPELRWVPTDEEHRPPRYDWTVRDPR